MSNGLRIEVHGVRRHEAASGDLSKTDIATDTVDCNLELRLDVDGIPLVKTQNAQHREPEGGFSCLVGLYALESKVAVPPRVPEEGSDFLTIELWGSRSGTVEQKAGSEAIDEIAFASVRLNSLKSRRWLDLHGDYGCCFSIEVSAAGTTAPCRASSLEVNKSEVQEGAQAPVPTAMGLAGGPERGDSREASCHHEHNPRRCPLPAVASPVKGQADEACHLPGLTSFEPAAKGDIARILRGESLSSLSGIGAHARIQQSGSSMRWACSDSEEKEVVLSLAAKTSNVPAGAQPSDLGVRGSVHYEDGAVLVDGVQHAGRFVVQAAGERRDGPRFM